MKSNIEYITISKSGYLYTTLIACVIFVDLVSSISTSKILHITDTIQFPLSVIIVVMMYPILDIIAELFGRGAYVFAVVARLLAGMIFIFLCLIIIAMPHPADWTHQADYEYILGFIPWVIIVDMTLSLLTSYINYKILYILRVFFNKRFFIIRSYLSSVCAVFIKAVTVITLIYMYRYGFWNALRYSINTALYELFFLAIISIIIPYIIFYIRKKYKI